MKYSKIKFLTFFAIICLIGLAPINDASANEGTAITEVESLEHDLGLGSYNSLVQVDSDTYNPVLVGIQPYYSNMRTHTKNTNQKIIKIAKNEKELTTNRNTVNRIYRKYC